MKHANDFHPALDGFSLAISNAFEIFFKTHRPPTKSMKNEFD
jgi:hypothetical protein